MRKILFPLAIASIISLCETAGGGSGVTSFREFAAAVTTGDIPLYPLPENFVTRPLPKGESPGFIFFPTGSYFLSRRYQEKLRTVAMWLNQNADIHLLVKGYPDEVSSTDYGLALAWQRALVLRKFLVICGVSPKRIFA
ncbi:MAG: OmpA family protein, partial [Candidatus Omnitrophica bacterium]|nr:OmpA family protein [Candidatus Omnitrophota bacterium]